jgi:hypothetical protein
LKFAESGRAQAKVGKRKRQVEKNPDYARQMRSRKKWMTHFGAEKTEAAELWPFWIILLFQDGERRKIGVASKNDRRAIIRDIGTRFGKRGLAKASWSVMVGKLGAMKGQVSGDVQGNVRGAAAAPVRVQKVRTAKEQFLRLHNRLNYMETAFPGIKQRALAKANRGLEYRLNESIRKAAEKANRGASA